MCRTALNVTGDLALTTLVAKGEVDDGPVVATVAPAPAPAPRD